MQLQQKHVPVTTACVFCHRDQESIFHVLMTCPFANSCWKWSGICDNQMQTLDFMSWFKKIQVGGNVTLLEEVAVIAWPIWKVRNDLLWNSKVCTTANVVLSAKLVLDQ